MGLEQRIVRLNPLHWGVGRGLRGRSTRKWEDSEGNTHVHYHATDVVSFNAGWITLRTGGWRTVTTKARMNEAAQHFDLGYSVYQRNWNWYVEWQGETYNFNSDVLSINRHTGAVEDGTDMVRPTSDMPRRGRRRVATGAASRTTAYGGELPEEREDISSELGFKPGKWEEKEANPPRCRNIAMAPPSVDVEIEEVEGLVHFKLLSNAAKSWWKAFVRGKGTTSTPDEAVSIIEAMLDDDLNVR